MPRANAALATHKRPGKRRQEEHDSQQFATLVAACDGITWADSAYSGGPCAQVLAAKGVTDQVCEKAPAAIRSPRNRKPATGKRAKCTHGANIPSTS